MSLEAWEPNRRVPVIRPGVTLLRIQAPAPFRLRGSDDEWETVQDSSAATTALHIYYVDLPVAQEQRVPFRFTFFWTDENRWEGKDYQMVIQKHTG